MRYYPVGTLYPDQAIQRLRKFHCVSKEETCILTLNGLFKYVKDDLVVFKYNLNNTKSLCLEDYVQGISVIVTPHKWRRIEVRYHLPYVHQKIVMKTYTFSLNQKSKLKFIIEKLENGSIDYYFTSPEEHSSHSLKEDIGSFLALLK